VLGERLGSETGNLAVCHAVSCCVVLCCRLVSEGVLTPQADIQVPEIPMDLATAVKLKKVGWLSAVHAVCGDHCGSCLCLWTGNSASSAWVDDQCVAVMSPWLSAALVLCPAPGAQAHQRCQHHL
jgi:hypothetical protein